MIIRAYKDSDEIGWIRCRVLSFLHTAYFDNVLNKKESYENPAIELVAELNGQIVRFLALNMKRKRRPFVQEEKV